MKGVAGPLVALEGNAQPLSQEGAEGEESTGGEGFDALLALVNAQAPNAPAPVKVLAPSVGVQCATVGEEGQPSGASAAKAVLDVAPTQVFLPWHGAATPAAVASDAATAAPDVDMVPTQADDTPSAAVSGQARTQDAQATTEPGSKSPSKNTAPPRKSGARAQDEGGERPEVNAERAPAPHYSIAQPLAASAASGKPQAATPRPLEVSRESASIRPQAAAMGTKSMHAAGAPEQPALSPGFVDLLAGDAGADSSLAPLGAPASSAATTTPAPPAVALPLSDPETQARVTSIEFFSAAETTESSESAAVETQQVDLVPETDARESAEPREQGPGDERAPADQGTPSEGFEGDGKPGSTSSAARFEVTEGKGMRGLDAVVASLLRPYAEKTEGAGGVRVPSGRVSHIHVETGKSQGTKAEERVAHVTQLVDAAALRRQEEERRGELRELSEPTPLPLMQQASVQADTPAQADSAQANAPLHAPAPPPPDPDAAMMGKIARGESLNAAVSIEHPELGSMDILVQNENGRIDVRATLETPRAAAVLRAHESALRYGVQQAGMTFGALRVNARTGETKVDKSRDVPKRRRERDWEA